MNPRFGSTTVVRSSTSPRLWRYLRTRASRLPDGVGRCTVERVRARQVPDRRPRNAELPRQLVGHALPFQRRGATQRQRRTRVLVDQGEVEGVAPGVPKVVQAAEDSVRLGPDLPELEVRQRVLTARNQVAYGPLVLAEAGSVADDNGGGRPGCSPVSSASAERGRCRRVRTASSWG